MRAILTNVPAFIEQPGRRVMQQKRGALDTLDTIFVGPTSLELGNMPGWGSQHPSFPFMVCETAEVTSREGGLSEVHAHYVGKVRSQTAVIVTPPLISPSYHEEILSWSNNEGTDGQINTSGGYYITRESRHTAKAVSFKYLTNERVPEIGVFAHPADGFLGILNQNIEITSVADRATGAAVRIVHTLVFTNDLVDYSINDLDNTWLEVTETYQTRGRIKTAIASGVSDVHLATPH